MTLALSVVIASGVLHQHVDNKVKASWGRKTWGQQPETQELPSIADSTPVVIK